MDAQVQTERRFLPALAAAITEWFPDLGGRALAVSEVSITKENVPTLPLVMVAFARSTADPPARSHHEEFEITDEFVVEFWLEPARYKKANGSETPFWSYYDYEKIRDQLLNNVIRWETPGGERIAYRSMSMEADQLAVTLTFVFRAVHRWCAPLGPHGEPIKQIRSNLCTPESCCPDVICPDPNPCDPCA